MIELLGLTKRFGELTAVDTLHLKVASGETFAAGAWRLMRGINMRVYHAAVYAVAVSLCCVHLSAAAGDSPKPRIAVVIDDFGLTYRKNVPDEDWMKIPWPYTAAVMPESPRTKAITASVKKAGKELIIHFPFDPFLKLDLPKDRVSPQDEAAIQKLLAKAFVNIPGAVGLNNHRSYKATTNRPLMHWFMGELKPHKLYFIDSRVSPKTVAYQEAKAAGIPCGINTIFLEEPKHYTKDFALRMLRVAANQARKKGSAIVIGHHYFHGTYDALVEMVPKLQAEGYEFVFASQVVR